MSKLISKVLFFVFVAVTLPIYISSPFAFADGPAVPAGTTAAPAAPLGAPAQSPLGMLLPFVAMFGVIYFLMIRPQQKKAKEQQAMITALKHGDEVITTSGMLGTITGITDKVVTVEVSDGVRVKMLKSQVSQVLKGQLKDNLA